jgi:hypothetical protein
MNLTEHDIAWIVAEVVRRLGNPSGGREPPELTPLPDRVITLETLRQHTGPTLTVTPKAIITPAARDELKRRGMKLIRGNESPTKQPQPAASLLAANLGADYQPKSIAQLAAGYGATIEQHPASALAAVIADHAEQVVRESKKAVWFTSTPAHAVCLANRHAGVWAVQGFDEATLADALKTTSANVLVIDPKGKSQYTLRKMLELFTGSGVFRGS